MKILTLFAIVIFLTGCSYMTRVEVGKYSASHSIHASNANR